jgi:hypothetical protein
MFLRLAVIAVVVGWLVGRAVNTLFGVFHVIFMRPACGE